MNVFEVAVPLNHCKKVTIEPSDEFGELMVVYSFPFDEVLIRNLDAESIKNVLPKDGKEKHLF